MSIYPISKKEKVFHTDWNRLISILFNTFYKATGSNIKGLVLSGILLTRRTVSWYSLHMRVFILRLQLPQTWKLKTHGITLKKDHLIMCTQRQGKKIRRISKTKKQKNRLTERILEHRRLTGKLFMAVLSALRHYYDKLCSEDELCIFLIL